MTRRYLLIESRDPFEIREVENDYALARNLVDDGKDATVFLIQNGVLAARRAAGRQDLAASVTHGVKVVCDEFSLRERGIYSENIVDGVEVGPLDIVVDHMVAGTKVIWL